jgi:hypothetical protein
LLLRKLRHCRPICVRIRSEEPCPSFFAHDRLAVSGAIRRLFTIGRRVLQNRRQSAEVVSFECPP